MAQLGEYGRALLAYMSQSGSEVSNQLRETEQALKPLRAKTAPADDLELERRKISQDAKQNLLLVQLALFLVFLSLVSYVALPRDWAHAITVLLICVGIGSGFFLRR